MTTIAKGLLFCSSNGARNLYLAGILLKLLDFFKENGISAIPFKGPLLAETVYGDLSLRCIYDLDILIPGSDLLLAYNLLLTSGYEPEIRLSRDRLVWYGRHEDNLAFTNKEKGIVVELHWELSGFYLHHSLIYGEIEPRLETAELLGRDVVNLQPDILLLYLCVHGAKHMWERLEWVCGVSELVRIHPELVWEELFESADALQCKRMLLLGLYLAHGLPGVELPCAVVEQISKDARLPKLASRVYEIMFPEIPLTVDELRAKRYNFFHLLVRDNVMDSIRYLLRLIFRPTNVEWLWLPVPASLSFLYYFLRPLRLGLELFRKVRGKGIEVRG